VKRRAGFEGERSTSKRALSVSLKLACVGLAMEAVYLTFFLARFPLIRYYRTDTDLGGIGGHSVVAFIAFAAPLATLFGLLLVGWRLTRDAGGKSAPYIILGFGALFAFTLCFVYPVTAIDVFTYVAQGRILIHYHQNPIFVPPSAHPHDAAMYLAGGWMSYGAPYGPLGILVDALPVLTAGGSVLGSLVLLKMMFGAMLLGAAVGVWLVLRALAPHAALSGFVLVAWSPLALFESVVNGHNDIAMMLLVVFGLLALVRGRLLTGLVLVFASCLIKYGSFPLVPLALVFALSRPAPWLWRLRLGLEAMGCWTAITITAFAPFWRGWSTFSRPLAEGGFHLQTFGSALSFFIPSVPLGSATTLGQILFVPLYVYCLVLATRRPRDFVTGLFLGSFGSLALAAANVKIWYAVWPATLAPLSRGAVRLAGFVLSVTATLSAVLYDFVFLWVGNGSLAPFPMINAWAYVVAFVPAALAFLPAIGMKRRQAAVQPKRESAADSRSPAA